jgi:hypothetical protein
VAVLGGLFHSHRPSPGSYHHGNPAQPSWPSPALVVQAVALSAAPACHCCRQGNADLVHEHAGKTPHWRVRNPLIGTRRSGAHPGYRRRAHSRRSVLVADGLSRWSLCAITGKSGRCLRGERSCGKETVDFKVSQVRCDVSTHRLGYEGSKLCEPEQGAHRLKEERRLPNVMDNRGPERGDRARGCCIVRRRARTRRGFL